MLNFLYPIALSIIAMSLLIFSLDYHKRPHIHMHANGEWKDINQHRLPLINKEDKIFVSDGKDIKLLDGFMLEYDYFGKPFFCKYEKKLITHWAPVPKPPKL